MPQKGAGTGSELALGCVFFLVALLGTAWLAFIGWAIYTLVTWLGGK